MSKNVMFSRLVQICTHRVTKRFQANSEIEQEYDHG
jgi:hypothetical protein